MRGHPRATGRYAHSSVLMEIIVALILHTRANKDFQEIKMSKKIFFSFLLTASLSTPVFSGTVDRAQSMLNRLGYNAGPVDGAYGKKTRGALEAFYAEIGGSYDGKLDANEVQDLQETMADRGLRFSPLSNVEVEYAFGWDGRKIFRAERFEQLVWFHERYVAGDYNNDGFTDYIGVGIPGMYRNVISQRDMTDNMGNSIKINDSVKGVPLLFWGQPNGTVKHDISQPFKRDDRTSGVLIPSITQADYDGDGDADIFVANSAWDWAGAPSALYLNNGDGTWTDVSKTNLKNNDRQFGHQTESGDIDGDGDIDIVTTTSRYSLECWMNDGNAVFKPRKCTNTRQETVAFSMADFDGDGDLDIYSAAEQEFEHSRKKGHDSNPSTHKNRILVNNGRGSFSKGHVFARRANCWDVNPYSEAFDIDGDGDYDIVNSITRTRYMFNGVEIIENLGNGKWKSQQFEVTKKSDFHPYEQKKWEIRDNCVAFKNGKFSGHDETSALNKHYQYIEFGDVDGDGDIDISLGSADCCAWDKKKLEATIQGRVIEQTEDGWKLSTFKRARIIK
jgi:hypothetical protein